MINMEAKEIIIKLIDNKLISGEEAIILLEAINKPAEIKIEPVTIPYYPPITTTPYYESPKIWCNSNDITANYSVKSN